MRLFDVLGKLKNEVKSAEGAVNKLVDIVSEVQARRGTESGEQIKYRPLENTVKSQNYYRQEPIHVRSREALLADLKKLIEAHFTEYDVKYEVPASDLDSMAHPACTPIQFLFYKNENPILAVVIVRKNTYRGMNVIGTRKICEEQNITYIRFFEEYENEDAYVINRIRSFL